MGIIKDQQSETNILKRPINNKIIGIFIAIVLVIVGLRFGIIGGLIGATCAGLVLKQFNVVKKDSAWVTETKGVRIAKYILLAFILIAISIIAFYLLK